MVINFLKRHLSINEISVSAFDKQIAKRLPISEENINLISRIALSQLLSIPCKSLKPIISSFLISGRAFERIQLLIQKIKLSFPTYHPHIQISEEPTFPSHTYITPDQKTSYETYLPITSEIQEQNLPQTTIQEILESFTSFQTFTFSPDPLGDSIVFQFLDAVEFVLDYLSISFEKFLSESDGNVNKPLLYNHTKGLAYHIINEPDKLRAIKHLSQTLNIPKEYLNSYLKICCFIITCKFHLDNFDLINFFFLEIINELEKRVLQSDTPYLTQSNFIFMERMILNTVHYELMPFMMPALDEAK